VSITIRDDWYYLAIFDVSFGQDETGRRVDVLGCVYKESATPDAPVPWRLRWRSRYVKDDKLGPDSEDEKSWYEAVSSDVTQTEDFVLDGAMKFFEGVRDKLKATKAVFLECHGDGQKMYDQMMRLPGFHLVGVTTIPDGPR
jgi:hypothetical protein